MKGHYTSSTAVQSHKDNLCCECIILYHTVIYSLCWWISSSVPQQSHYHRTSIPPESWSWNINTINSSLIWCKPVSSRIRSINSTKSSRTVSMTEESSVDSGANITDHHIAMIRNDVITQTKVYICKCSSFTYMQTIHVTYSLSGVSTVRGSL